MSLNSPSMASSSLQPNSAIPATYHPQPRPPPSGQPTPYISYGPSGQLAHVHNHQPIPFERMDTHAIKQELHDALGEDGLPYWKALNGYLLGQIGRGELEVMVKSWFKGEKVKLHNKLLLSLLNNASAPPASHTPVSALTAQKRKRVGPEDPEYDIDETLIDPRVRVQNWVMGMGGRERARVRRAVLGKSAANGEEDAGVEDEKVAKNAGWSTFSPSSLIPPLAAPSRHLPSSHQLSLRLSQFAKQHSLALAPDAIGDIGEFMAVGVDSHLGDVFHEIVSLTGRDRPGLGTIRMPGRSRDVISGHVGSVGPGGPSLGGREVVPGAGDDLPKPDLSTLQQLFLLNASLHPQISPALHRLATSQTLAEAEANKPFSPPSSSSSLPSGVESSNRMSAGRSTLSAVNKAERVTQNLLASSLLKLDKAGRQSEMDGADGKKERKHNLHWKYEDPAIILKDVLG
ncbi:hypothetical protein IAU60_003266 [Kwoniella sp. DSM 27419]